MRPSYSTLLTSFVTIFIAFYPNPSQSIDLVKDLSKAVNQLRTAVDLFDGFNLTAKKTQVQSLGPNVTLAKTYIYLTGAAYCFNLPLWTCEYCKKAKALGYKFAAQVENKGTNTLAIIAINKKAKEIVVAFRGTFNVANVVEDAVLTMSPIAVSSDSKTGTGIVAKVKGVVDKVKNAITGKGKGSKGKTKSSASSTSSSSSTSNGPLVHTGFLAATNSLYPKLVKKLAALLKTNKGFSLIVTGHSLGAGMGSVFLYMVMEKMGLPSDFPTPSSYSFFGYGEPRVGNQAYADYWNKKKMQVARIVNKGDIIAHIAPATGLSSGYFHHGTELWISPTDGDKVCSKSVYEDPKCSNSLGPVYSVLDHIFYWDVQYLKCALENPITLLAEFVVPLAE